MDSSDSDSLQEDNKSSAIDMKAANSIRNRSLRRKEVMNSKHAKTKVFNFCHMNNTCN